MPVQVHGTTTEVTCTIPVRSMTTECHGTRANPGPHNIQCAPTPDAAHARQLRTHESFTDSLTPQHRARSRHVPPARAAGLHVRHGTRLQAVRTRGRLTGRPVRALLYTLRRVGSGGLRIFSAAILLTGLRQTSNACGALRRCATRCAGQAVGQSGPGRAVRDGAMPDDVHAYNGLLERL
eukprot:COSAG02_NODE_3837_length_6168_cov_16.481134_6_plen_180_part_00